MHRIDAEGHLNNKFTDGGPGVPATVVDANMMNALQEELCKVIEDAGMTLYGSGATDNWDQLVPALKYWNRRQTIHTTSGTSSAFTITTSPAISSYANGMSFFIKIHTFSWIDCTLAVDGLAAIPMKWDTGESLWYDALSTDGIYEVVYNDSVFYVVSPSRRELKDARGDFGSLDLRLEKIVQDEKGAGPGTGNGYLNEFSSNAIPQLWGTHFGMNPGGYGFLSFTKNATGEWDYLFDRTYQDGTYAVTVNFESNYDNTWTYQVGSKTVTGCRLKFFHTGVPTDPTIRINVTIHANVVP